MTTADRRRIRTEVELMTTIELYKLASHVVGTSATGELALRVQYANKVLNERRRGRVAPRKSWNKKMD